jgi:hypothetical protein
MNMLANFTEWYWNFDFVCISYLSLMVKKPGSEKYAPVHLYPASKPVFYYFTMELRGLILTLIYV